MRRFKQLTIALVMAAVVAPGAGAWAAGTKAAAGKATAKSHKSSVWDSDEALVPLEEQVAVRHRYELRKGRFEVGPSFGFALNRAFMNAVMLGLRAQYHINDYLSVGTEWTFGINFRSPLTNELDDTYENTPAAANNPQDLFDNNVKKLSRLDVLGDIRVAFTPFSGKMGVFSALFLGYDLYAFAGLAFGKTSNDFTATPGGGDGDVDATNEKFNVGFAWGLGLHVYVNNWISIGIEFKDLMFSDNETGQDLTRGRESDEQASCVADPTKCRLVNGDDRRFLNHFFFGLNVTFFLPMKPDIAF